jgi:predicted CoA-binding protein
VKTTRAAIDRFLADRTAAVVGVSASGRGFGFNAYRELKRMGYRLLPVHPTADAIQGDTCWRKVTDLPADVERLLVVVRPERAEQVVREAAGSGIRYVWLQQGAESPSVLQACQQQGLEVVHGHCILMFAEPTASFHKIHRWLWKLLGKVPS